MAVIPDKPDARSMTGSYEGFFCKVVTGCDHRAVYGAHLHCHDCVGTQQQITDDIGFSGICRGSRP